MSQTGSLRERSATFREPLSGEATADVISIYDRFTALYDMMFRINGYQASVERFLRETSLPLRPGARILDAGCGTGLLTLSMLQALERPARITSVDLSKSSLLTAKRAAGKARLAANHKVRFVQANAMALPFADESFDFVATAGVLEYLPLDDGLEELARVVAPGGHFLHLPCVPSPMTRLLELMFRFKAHPIEEVLDTTARRFRIIKNQQFKAFEPIGWSKVAILAQKP